MRHDGTLPTSTYRPGQRGNEFKPEAAPLPGETIIVKHTNSAFIGTEFERLLRQSRIYTLVIMGVITNNSLEATVRMSGNLGFAPMRPPAGSFLGAFGRRPLCPRIVTTGRHPKPFTEAAISRPQDIGRSVTLRPFAPRLLCTELAAGRLLPLRLCRG